MSNELAQLFPTGKQISINDENLTIKPFKFGELPKVFKAIDPIFGALTHALSQSSNQVEIISKLMAEGGDNVIDLIVISSKKDRAWVEDLDLDQAIELFTAVLEVNLDFFVRKALPRLNSQMDRINQVGQTQ